MRPSRPLIALALGASLIVGSFSAHAATKVKPVCNLVIDPAGDGNGIDLGSTPYAPPAPQVRLPAEAAGPSIDALDLLSGDVATDKKRLTVVIRVKALATMATEAATGMTWGLYFTNGNTTFSVLAHTNPVGATNFDAAYSTPGINSLYAAGSVTGYFDLKKNEIHMTAPLELFEAQEDFKTGTKLTNINVLSGPEIAIPEATGKLGGGALLEGPTYYSDTTANGKPYALGAPSCVIPGK